MGKPARYMIQAYAYHAIFLIIELAPSIKDEGVSQTIYSA